MKKIKSTSLRKLHTKILSMTLILLMLFMYLPVNVSEAAVNITLTGFRANEGGGGKLDLGWTTGELGNTWAEGEWVPYQLVLKGVQTDYPNLEGFPGIEISYDFTSSGDRRFVDLVRYIQVGSAALTDLQAWPNDSGVPYPMTTREEIELAQKDKNNNPSIDNAWSGFTLLNLPNNQVNVALDGSSGTTDDSNRKFVVTTQNLKDANLGESDTLVLYFQLHESRTFIWQNSLQSGYNTPPTDAWGGYLYSGTGFSNDSKLGSSYVSGASGHVTLVSLSGAKTVPIPIPPEPEGDISGYKYLDANNNGIIDEGDTPLQGWEIKVSGSVENIYFEKSIYTDENGYYNFPSVTAGTTWHIEEILEDGYFQTYPSETGVTMGVASSTFDDPLYAWDVALTLMNPIQGDVNFANVNVGDLEITKVIDTNDTIGLTIPEFDITITGPSYPNGDTKTFSSPDDLVQLWTNLIPGVYMISEEAPEGWTLSGDTQATVIAGQTGEAAVTGTVTNTYNNGDLEITKVIDTNDTIGLTIPSFDITITGPSYPNGDTKTFSSPSNLVQMWTNLMPGDYTVSETPQVGWEVSYNPEVITVIAGQTGEGAVTGTVTNTYNNGDLEINKFWGDTPEEYMPLEISVTVTGPSYPNGTQVILSSGNGWSETLEDLIPGSYTVVENTLGSEWIVMIDDSNPTVYPDQVTIVNITNTMNYMDETAWGYDAGNAIPFTSLDRKLRNWGWTNGPYANMTSGSAITLDLYAGAGGNDLSNGKYAGTVEITFNADETINVVYDTIYEMTEIHFYIGENELPELKNGKYVNSPGQFPYNESNGVFSDGNKHFEMTISFDSMDEFYIAAHAVVKVPIEY